MDQIGKSHPGNKLELADLKQVQLEENEDGGLNEKMIDNQPMSDEHQMFSINQDSGGSLDENMPLVEGKKKGNAPVGSIQLNFDSPKSHFAMNSEGGWVTQFLEKRTIHMTGRCEPRTFPSNKNKNTKYNICTLIPVVLFNQFKFFFNLFFLLIALSQFVPPLKVGFMFTYLAPLVVVLSITILKEAWDDIQRFNRDKETNNTKYEKLTRAGTFKPIKSQNIKVGDIIKIHHNQRLPCDMILLYTTERSESVFIRTDQLDGETDWKLRRPISFTQKCNPIEELAQQEGMIVANAPNRLIYDFKGFYKTSNGPDASQESLSLENTLWTNTVLASAGFVLGIVVYTGIETRSKMNSKQASTKVGKLDMELNRLSKLLFLFMVALSALIVVISGFKGTWEINFFRFILLMSSIIPISLRVNLDLAKVFYSFQLYRDSNIEGTIPRNSTIPEELGRIQYLLTDKTGTLTKNDMVFKKVTFEYAQFDQESIADLKQYLHENCEQYDGPYADKRDPNPAYGRQAAQSMARRKRDQHFIIRDFMTALAVCHNVTPVYPDEDNKNIKEFQASSPDEVALVKFADSMGMRLIERDQQIIKINNTADTEEDFQVLANFPFSSDTKRMGIVVKHLQTNQLIFYLKGAEVVMKNKVKPNQRVVVDEACENLALEGLRTLVISAKALEEEELNKWMVKYKRAQSDLGNREAMVTACIEELEEDMELLGITGVEGKLSTQLVIDKLQDEVALTIESLRNAGVQVWMLTGDKVETATCIAISAGFKSRRQKLYFMKDMTNVQQCENELREFERMTDTLLMIDGHTLDLCTSNKTIEDLFYRVSTQAPAVCVCRCSPTQKAIITKKIGSYTKKRTAAVGDGGNDVGMILEANVGIGIVGKEGKQASLASDFSINQFSYLRRLLLWHGRLSYKRSAALSQFIIHRGLIITVIQAIFSLIFYYVAIPIYNGYLMLGYTTIYTSLPVFSLVLDEDVNVNSVMKFPPLYKTLQLGRSLNTKTFLIWMFKSIFQGAIIMLGTVIFFNDSFANIVTITFSSLILIELLNVYSEVHKPNIKIFAASILTGVMYILSIAILRAYFDTSYITWTFVLKVIAVSMLSWMPLHLVKCLFHKISPTEEQKIMKQDQ